MNTETDNNEFEALQVAFGDKGTKVNAINYGHPHAESIIEGAEEVLKESETGRLLLRAKDKCKVPVSVMKGEGEAGFSPDAKAIYVQVSGKVTKPDAKLILQYVKALREADQHYLGFVAPDPNKDIMEYATVMHAKNMDAIVFVCKFVKELTNSLLFSDLIDAISQLGYKEVYSVYDKDGSDEDIFSAYAGR